MKIKRTFKEKSLKFGKTEFCDEETFATVARQTMMGLHEKGQCSRGDRCLRCHEPALAKLKAGTVMESYFSKFEMVQ